MSAGGIEMAVGVVAKAELFTWRRPVAEFNSRGMATADELTPGADGSATAASWTVRTSVVAPSTCDGATTRPMTRMPVPTIAPTDLPT